MIIVTGHVTARANSIANLTHAALEHVRRSRQEQGCITHEVSVSAENPLRLLFIERWQDEAALSSHFALPASRAFWRLLQDLAADPGAMQIYAASETRV